MTPPRAWLLAEKKTEPWSDVGHGPWPTAARWAAKRAIALPLGLQTKTLAAALTRKFRMPWLKDCCTRLWSSWKDVELSLASNLRRRLSPHLQSAESSLSARFVSFAQGPMVRMSRAARAAAACLLLSPLTMLYEHLKRPPNSLRQCLGSGADVHSKFRFTRKSWSVEQTFIPTLNPEGRRGWSSRLSFQISIQEEVVDSNTLLLMRLSGSGKRRVIMTKHL